MPCAAVAKQHGVTEAGEAVAHAGDAAGVVTLFQFDQQSRPPAPDGVHRAVEDFFLVALDIDLDEVDVTEGEIVEARERRRETRGDLGIAQITKTAARMIGAALAVTRHPEFGFALFIGQRFVMQMDITEGSAADSFRWIGVGLESLDPVAAARQPVGIDTAICTDVDGTAALAHQSGQARDLRITMLADMAGPQDELQSLVGIKHRPPLTRP